MSNFRRPLQCTDRAKKQETVVGQVFLKHGAPKLSSSSRGSAAESCTTSLFVTEEPQPTNSQQLNTERKRVRFCKRKNGEMNMASMGTDPSNVRCVRVTPSSRYPLGPPSISKVPLLPCVSQGIHPCVSFPISDRDRRGGTVVGKSKVVGGRLCTSQTRRFFSPMMWCTAASPKGVGIFNTLSESPHRWIIESTSSFRCPSPLGPGSMSTFWRQGVGRIRRVGPRSGSGSFAGSGQDRWTLMRRWVRLGERKRGMNRRSAGSRKQSRRRKAGHTNPPVEPVRRRLKISSDIQRPSPIRSRTSRRIQVAYLRNLCHEFLKLLLSVA